MRIRKLRPVRVRIASLVLLAVGVAGCDKCGNRVSLNVPSLPNTCGAQPGQAK